MSSPHSSNCSMIVSLDFSQIRIDIRGKVGCSIKSYVRLDNLIEHYRGNTFLTYEFSDKIR